MAQSAISFSILVSKYSFHIIDFDIGFEINACQPEILVSNLNEQFRTALIQTHIFMPYRFYSVRAAITLADVLYGQGNSMWCRERFRMVQNTLFSVDLDDIFLISMLSQ